MPVVAPVNDPCAPARGVGLIQARTQSQVGFTIELYIAPTGPEGCRGKTRGLFIANDPGVIEKAQDGL
jgi:hypothetical protein